MQPQQTTERNIADCGVLMLLTYLLPLVWCRANQTLFLSFPDLANLVAHAHRQIISLPTEKIAIFEPQNPTTGVSKLRNFRRSTDFKAEQLWNARSGSSEQHMLIRCLHVRDRGCSNLRAKAEGRKERKEERWEKTITFSVIPGVCVQHAVRDDSLLQQRTQRHEWI